MGSPLRQVGAPQGLPLDPSWFPDPRTASLLGAAPVPVGPDPAPQPSTEPADWVGREAATLLAEEGGSELFYLKNTRREGLAILEPPTAGQDAPPFSWARRPHPAARYLDVSGSPETLQTDQFLFRARAYQDLAQPSDIITWDFLSPIAEHNNTARGSACSIEWRYSSTGQNAVDFNAGSVLQVRVWDARHPGGRRTLYHESQLHRSELTAWAGVAARDPGAWRLRITRGDEQVEESFTVVAPTQPSSEWVSRSGEHTFDVGSPLVAYVNDESLLHSRTYALPQPGQPLTAHDHDHDSDDPELKSAKSKHKRKFRVVWNWYAPDSAWNATSKDTYYTAKLNYVTDGEEWRLQVRAWDYSYPKGRLVRDEGGPGSLDAVTLVGGAGLATYGNWRMEERVKGEKKVVEQFETRQLKIEPVVQRGVFYPDNRDSVPYQLKIDAFPSTWSIPPLEWSLRIQSDQGVLQSFEGQLDNPGNSLLLSQPWDGTDQLGQPVEVGTAVSPAWQVGFDDPRFNALQGPLLRAAAAAGHVDHGHTGPEAVATPNLDELMGSQVAARGQQRATLQAAGEYVLHGDFPFSNENPPPEEEPREPGYILADDVLRVYLNGDLIYESPDTFAQTTEEPIVFNAEVGDELRVTVDDVHGVCRRLSNLFLLHTESGESEQLDFEYLDCNEPFDPQGIFFDRTYEITIPSDGGGGTPPPKIQDNLAGTTQYGLPANSASRVFVGLGPGSDGYSRQVNVTTGTYRMAQVDVALPTRGLPIVIGRYYLSEVRDEFAPGGVALSPGFRWSFETYFLVDDEGATLVRPDGGEDYFRRTGVSSYAAGRQDMTSTLSQSGTLLTLRFKDKSEQHFQIRSTPDGLVAPLVREVDRNGNANTYIYNPRGRLVAIQDPAGRAVTLLYDPNQTRLIAVTDWIQRQVQYTYQNGLLTRVAHPGNKIYNYTWEQKPFPIVLNGFGVVYGEHFLVSAELGGLGLREKQIQENPSGRLVDLRTSDGLLTTWRSVSGSVPRTRLSLQAERTQSWQFDLDNQSRITKILDPLQGLTSFTFDARSNVTKVINSLNQSATFTWDTRRNPLTVTNQQNKTTEFTWNSDDNLTRVKDALGQTTSFHYDNRSNLILVEDPQFEPQSFTYNAAGQMLTSTDALGHAWNFTYDPNGYLSSIAAPSSAPSEPQSAMYFTVDEIGRRTAATDSLGRTWRYTYDVRDRLLFATMPAVSPRGGQVALPEATLRFAWNDQDQLVSTTDPLGRITRYTYDSAQRLTQVLEPGLATPTRYQYDGHSNVVRMTNTRGFATTFRYDDKNRLIALTYPGSPEENFTYDVLGNLKRWDKGDGTVVTYSYL